MAILIVDRQFATGFKGKLPQLMTTPTPTPLSPEDPVPTICLVMIVRNEGPRMPRLLASLKDIIDEVVISDTGSTDNTIEATRDFCNSDELNVRCIIDETPFRDFGFNRSRSITVAVEKSECDYLLFMDADMRLVKGPKFSKRDLLGTGVSVLSLMQKGGGLEYYNMRIMKRDLPNLRCVGVTHEHYAWDGPFPTTNVPPAIMYINDIGDGGSKSDKFPRDYRLLKQGLIDEPGNVRYMFYLAETCRHDHKFEESIKFYKMRIKAGGWDEEIYRSMYGVSLCYMALNKPDKMDAWAIRAHLFRPCRVESLYAACKWHRERSEHARAYAFFQLGSRIARPLSDVLFVETAPYEWAWDYEFAILAYYVEREAAASHDRPQLFKNPIGTTMCLRRIISALGSVANSGTLIPKDAFDNELDNVKHYAELLPAAFRRVDVDCPVIPGFTSSTAAVTRLRCSGGKGNPEGTTTRGLSRIVRYVDYKIKRDDGGYVYTADGTVNSMYAIQKSPEEPWKILKINYDGILEWKNTRIKGIEDIHLLDLPVADAAEIQSHLAKPPRVVTGKTISPGIEPKNRAFGLGTSVQYSIDGHAAMILLEIDMGSGQAWPIKRFQRISNWEKNHAPIADTGYCVYSWGPRLSIYNLMESTDEKMIFTHNFTESEIPGWFRDMRGSTAGIAFPSQGPTLEYWFLTHNVVHGAPRRYMHSVVRLDAKSFRPVGFSVPFSFDDYHVEFAGGIAFDNGDNTLVVGYSVFDSTSKEIRIPVGWLLQTLMITVKTTIEPSS